MLAPSQGNVQTLANGNMLVGYGGVPEISEFAQGGSLVFDAHQPLDMSFYRAFRFPWSATPAKPPAVLASLNNTGEETTVHASWNGATASPPGASSPGSPRVAQGTGHDPVRGLRELGDAPSKQASVQVQALDSAGHVIGTSEQVRVGSYASSLPSPQATG